MSDYGPNTYGDRWAGVYDDWIARYMPTSDSERIVERLADLAGARSSSR